MASDSTPRALSSSLRRIEGETASSESCPPDVIAAAVAGLAGCDETVLSETVCGGLLDPSDVVEWVDRAKRLLRFRVDEAELRSEVPAVADGLFRLLAQVELAEDGPDARAVTTHFVSSLVGLREKLSRDVEAAYEGDPAAGGYDEIVVAYPSIRALALHRMAHVLYEQNVPLLPRIIGEIAHDWTGIDIHPGATIGDYCFIDHGTGVVIGETAVIGDRVRLYQGVTIGAASLRDSSALRGQKRHPTIEDEVTIYAGATILGGDTTIGRGAVIGGSVFLTESVPPGTRVMAEAPRQLMKGEAGAAEEEPMQLHWDI